MLGVAKKNKMKGMIVNAKGEFVQVEILGPETFEEWEKDYRGLITCGISWDAGTLAGMGSYRDKIAKLHAHFGEQCWALIYQAEVRCRHLQPR